jgi:hypothetical protein
VPRRQWLAGVRAQHTSGQDLGVLREPVSHGRPTPAQLAELKLHFAAGSHQQAVVTGRPIDPQRLAAAVERHYWTPEVRAGQRLHPIQLARELGGDQRQISQQLAELRPALAPPAAGAGYPAVRSSQLAWRLGVSDSYVRHITWQLRTARGSHP